MGIATRIIGSCWPLALGVLVMSGGWSTARAEAESNLAEPLCFATTAQDRGAGCLVSPKPKQLDLLLIAEPAPITTFATRNDFPRRGKPEGWVYKYCWRPGDGTNRCPPGHESNLYGGTRLQLEPGDVLKIRLINHLPPVLDAKHAQDPGGAFLSMNPTNIHTHGLLVEPRFPTGSDPTYGDNVFVMTLNPQNFVPTEAFDPTKPPPAESSHIHGDLRIGYTDYRIEIPKDHPAGLFWLHPHVHGIALNQVSSGLASIITIGHPADYIFKEFNAGAFVGPRGDIPVRHIILKDAQIKNDPKRADALILQDQEEPKFCGLAIGEIKGRDGSCLGVDTTADGGSDNRGGRWYFTLNGQQYPTIPVSSTQGQIWRITAASASVSYNLSIRRSDQKPGEDGMLFQILALDGVARGRTQTLDRATAPENELNEAAELESLKIHPRPCPDSPSETGKNTALCADHILMMPGSRAELLVSYRDRNGNLAKPTPGAFAVFQTTGFNTGPSGDTWPAVNLAKIAFSGPGPDPDAAQTVAVKDWDVSHFRPAWATNSAPDPSCPPLAPGHYRRVFFGVPDGDPNGFGLGYEEVDQKDNPVGLPAKVSAYDPDIPTICAPLRSGERWQLVNLADEDHNFHIHQVRFQVMKTDKKTGDVSLRSGPILYHDNYPLRHADAACSVADFDNGNCKDKVHPVNVWIQFNIAGDFVYHCHILEHEDGGMMARIRVRPPIMVGQAPAK